MFNHFFKKTLVQAILFGGVLGISNYLIDHYGIMEEWPFLVGLIQILFFGGFIGFAYGKIQDKKLAGISSTLFILFNLAITFSIEVSAGDFLIGFYVILMWLFLGLLVVAFSETQKDFPLSLDRYLYKSIEAIIVNLFLLVIGIIIGALGFQLIEVTGFSVPEEVRNFSIFFVLSVIPFVGVDLIYDFKKPLSEQKDAFGIMTLITKVLYFVSYILAVFLGAYILLLATSAFKKILDTGNTTPIFLGITAVNTIAIFFTAQSENFLKRRLWSTAALIIETLILLLVALYAIVLRVGQHGFTVNRLLVLSAVSFLLAAYSVYAFHLGARDQKALLQGIRLGNLIIVPLFVIYALVNFTPYDLRALEAYSQLHQLKEDITQ